MHSPIVKHEAIVFMNLNLYRSQGVGGEGFLYMFLKCGSDLKYPSTLKDKDPFHLEEFFKRNFHKYKVPFNTLKEFLLLFYNTYIQVCIQICIMIGLRLYIAFSNLPTLKIQFHELCARIVW